MGILSRLNPFRTRFEAKTDPVFSQMPTVAAPINAAQMDTLTSFLFGERFGESENYYLPPALCWRLYKQVSTLAKVVDLIADQAARLGIVIEVDGQPDPEHPFGALLARPGYGRSRRQLIKELAVQQLVSGTGYLHGIGMLDRPPVALDVIKSHFMNPIQGPDMWPSQFRYSEGTRSANFMRDGAIDLRYTDGALNEMVAILDTMGDLRGVGLSRLQAVRSDVDLRLRGTEHNAALMRNGARPSGAFVFKENLTPEQAEDVKAQINAQLGGPGGAGKIGVFGGGEATFQELSKSMRDMDWTNLHRLTDDAIVARYNVPITLFNTDAQTDNNYETAWYMLYELAVLPTAEIITDGLARFASVRYGEDISITIDPLSNEVLSKHAQDRSVRLYAANLVTRNEAREMIGYEETIGGDTFYQSMGLVPAGYDYFTDHGSPSPEVAAALGLNPDGSDPAADAKKPAPKPEPDTAESDSQKSLALGGGRKGRSAKPNRSTRPGARRGSAPTVLN